MEKAFEEEKILCEVVGERKVLINRHIMKDELVELRGLEPLEKCPCPLRRFEAYDAEAEVGARLLTNELGFGSTTILAVRINCCRMDINFKARGEGWRLKPL